MASKRQKGESSSSSSFDKSRFCSKEAEDRYHKSIINRGLIQERGLEVQEALIEERGWEEFVKQPQDSVVPIVREFYANVSYHRNYKVYVRGKQVKFNAEVINQYYNLPSFQDDDYHQYIEQGPDFNEVIHEITTAGTTWRLSTRGEPLTFRAGNLTRYNKTLFMFIIGKMMPSSHTTDVTRERAALIFSIQRGDSINVGQIIQNSIIHCASPKTTGGLGHPSLITALCAQAGVEWDVNEEIQHPKSLITWGFMVRRMQDPQDREAEQPQERIPQFTVQQQLHNLEINQQQLRQEMGEFRENVYSRLDTMSHEMREFRNEMRELHDYQIAFNQASQRRWDEQMGSSHIPYPTPPISRRGQSSTHQPRPEDD